MGVEDEKSLSHDDEWGFPWTTGTVSIMNTELFGTKTATSTITAMGSDARTTAGKGAITLVAGGTAHHTMSGLDYVALDTVRLNFADGTPTPSMSTPGFAALAVLLGLGAGYRMRARFGSAKAE